ncbi:MAG: FGGY family carbohydrate kinase [Oscillospiraceae bacterium]|nr:FGGY family carbohydrate kinase [Oscillospiraceae bacterium]
MSVYLSVDLGTTGCRSILFDQNLCELSAAYEEYGLITPKENWVEQDAQLWWELMVRTSQSAISQSDINPLDIKAISISSQSETLVPVDKEFNPICNAISWLDNRTGQEVKEIEKDFGNDKICRVMGKPATTTYTLPKLLWLKKHQPEIFNSAYKFLMPMDFLIAKLTGRCITDHSMASGTLLYDLKNFCWYKEFLDFYGIEEERLPEIAFAGTNVGKVLPEVAELLGVSPECTVAVGAQDQKCAAFAAGLRDGVMTISLGTATAIEKRWTEAKTEENHGVSWCGYVEENAFVTEGVINTAGTCLRWVRDQFFKGEKYRLIDEEAFASLESGSSLLFYPHLSGAGDPDFYPESTGVFYGINLATNRGDFALSVMEGIAFQIRVILEAMQAYGNVHTLIIFGGGAKSELWSQIIADATGLKVSIPKTPEAAGAGAAMLAAKAVGEDLEPLDILHIYEPSERCEAYNKKYAKFREIEKKLWD